MKKCEKCEKTARISGGLEISFYFLSAIIAVTEFAGRTIVV